MKEHNYKMNISQAEFFNILGNHTLKDMPLSSLNRNTASDTTLYGSVNGKSAKLCPHPADKYKPFNPINEITAEERGTQLDVCVKSYTNKMVNFIKSKFSSTLFKRCCFEQSQQKASVILKRK